MHDGRRTREGLKAARKANDLETASTGKDDGSGPDRSYTAVSRKTLPFQLPIDSRYGSRKSSASSLSLDNEPRKLVGVCGATRR